MFIIRSEKGAKKHKELFQQQQEFENMDHIFARECLSNAWINPYKDTNTTPVMLALSNKQYHVVEWLIKEKKAQLPTILFQQQSEFDKMDYEFARECIGQKYFE